METWDLSTLFALDTEDALPFATTPSSYAPIAPPAIESWDLSSLFSIDAPAQPAPAPIVFADDFDAAYLEAAELVVYLA